MDFEDWEPIYREILDDFGYDPEADQAAALILESMCPLERLCHESCLRSIIGKEVTVIGHAPNLESELESTRILGTIIAADGASLPLMARGIVPHLIVTDLDGDIDAQVECNRRGTVVVAHGHGDNIDALRRHVPRFTGPLTPTVQCRPFGCLRNFGGFTDGDRGVMLAAHFGAQEIHLMGFDFNNPRDKGGKERELKLRKLQWAKRIIIENARNTVTGIA